MIAQHRSHDPNGISFLFLIIGSLALYFDSLVRFTDINFFVSDVLFLLSAASLLINARDQRHLLSAITHNPTGLPFLLFALFAAAQGINAVAPDRTLLALLQLCFIFWILVPVIVVHTKVIGRFVVLWWIHWLMIPFAGLLSLMAQSGIVVLGENNYWRYENPLLGVNGFWVFGLVSPFLLHRMMNGFIRTKISATITYALLWGLGFAGVALSGVRTGLALTALSLIWVMWYYRPVMIHGGFLRLRIRNMLVVLPVLVIVTIGWTLEQEFEVFRTRISLAEQGVELDTVATRFEINRVALADIPDRLIWGVGLNQFPWIHPELGDTIHNIYLQLLYETGLVGLIAFLWLFINLLRRVRAFAIQARQSGDTRLIAYSNASLFVVIGVMLAWMIYPIPYTRFEWLLLFLAAGPSAIATRGFNPVVRG